MRLFFLATYPTVGRLSSRTYVHLYIKFVFMCLHYAHVKTIACFCSLECETSMEISMCSSEPKLRSNAFNASIQLQNYVKYLHSQV